MSLFVTIVAAIVIFWVMFCEEQRQLAAEQRQLAAEQLRAERQFKAQLQAKVLGSAAVVIWGLFGMAVAVRRGLLPSARAMRAAVPLCVLSALTVLLHCTFGEPLVTGGALITWVLCGLLEAEGRGFLEAGVVGGASWGAAVAAVLTHGLAAVTCTRRASERFVQLGRTHAWVGELWAAVAQGTRTRAIRACVADGGTVEGCFYESIELGAPDWLVGVAKFIDWLCGSYMQVAVPESGPCLPPGEALCLQMVVFVCVLVALVLLYTAVTPLFRRRQIA